MLSPPDYPTFWEEMLMVVGSVLVTLAVALGPAGVVGYAIFRVTEWRRKRGVQSPGLRRRT